MVVAVSAMSQGFGAGGVDGGASKLEDPEVNTFLDSLGRGAVVSLPR